MIKLSISKSLRKSIDIVVAITGISGPDDIFNIEGELEDSNQ